MRAFIVLILASVLSFADGTAHISGVVTDQNGAIFPPPVQITLTSEGRTIVRQLDNFGRFSEDIPPGKYEITATVPQFYFPYRRAPITLHAGESINLHLVPRVKVLAVALNADASETVTKANPISYEAFTRKDGTPILIEFEKRKKSGKEIQFSGAVVTLGAWTIRADNVFFNPKTMGATLKGKVRISCGETVKVETSKAFVDLNMPGAPDEP